MTPRQITIARQALDNPRTPGCFITNIKSESMEEWDRMVDAGLATKKPHVLRMDRWVYRLTEAGIAAAREDA